MTSLFIFLWGSRVMWLKTLPHIRSPIVQFYIPLRDYDVIEPLKDIE